MRVPHVTLASVTDDVPTIAVLDDEAQMRKALARLLRTHGYRVALFEDGESFLAAQARRPFACVLLDLQMPGMDGFSVLQTLQTGQRRSRVIVITAHDHPGNEARVMELGAQAYLAKPVDEDPLLEAIARNLQERIEGEGRPC